jgi:phosphoglycolate phosphatase
MRLPANIEHVCFDKDGTLTDVHAYWVHTSNIRVRRAIAEWSLPADASAILLNAMGVDESTRRLRPKGPVGYYPRPVVIASVQTALAGIRPDTSTDDIANLFAAVDRDQQVSGDYDIRLLPGVREVVQRLVARGVRLSIYSSDRRENTERVLNSLDLRAGFAAIVGGGCVQRAKPDPEGFHNACRQVGIAPEKSAYIGDTLDDLAMTEAAGALSISVATGLEDYEALKGSARNVLKDLSELE